MEQYEIIKTILRLLPILSIFIVFIFVRNLKWYYRYLITVLLGWIIVFVSVALFWDYSFNYAPTQEIRHQVGMKDGAPVAFSSIFGWVYALILMLIMDGVHKSYLHLSKRYRQRTMNKIKTISILFAVLILFYIGFLTYVHSPEKGGRYFFPEKYAGWVCISYNVKDMPPLDIQDGFLVHKIPQNGILKTSSNPRLSPSYDEYYYYTKGGTREAKELEHGGGFTVQMEDQKEFTSYFWIHSSYAYKDYEKYVKEMDVYSNPPCGQWEK